MARLPVPGSDDGNWGVVLNDFLGVAHNADGSVAANAIGGVALQDGSVTKAKLSATVRQSLDLADSALQAAPVSSVNGQTGAVALTKTDVGLGSVDNTADTDKPVSSAVQAALDGKADTGHGHANYLPIKNGNPTLTDSSNDRFARVDISDDATATSGWPDRLAFYFNGTRTGYHNEYGELRARPAKSNTVAFRTQKWAGSSTVDIMQVTNSDNSTVYFGVGPTAISAAIPINSTANITTTGTVSGSNIGNKVTTSSTPPSSPSVGDVWIDTSA